MLSENGAPPNKKRRIGQENGWPGRRIHSRVLDIHSEWGAGRSAGESELKRPDGYPVAVFEAAPVDFLAIDAGPVPAVEVLELVPFVRPVDDRVLIGDERVVETDVARHGTSK